MRMAAALLALGTRRMDWEDLRGCVVRDVALDAVGLGEGLTPVNMSQ